MKTYEPESSKGLTGSHLKWLAILTMTIDHIGAFLLEPALASGLVGGQLSLINTVCRLIGRLAFPIFTFLLVEGFAHTRNVKKYLLQMGLFTIISEIPFDLARDGRWFDFSYQNVFFTLFIGLLTITIFNVFKTIKVIRWVVPLIGMMIAALLKTDYSAVGVLMIFVFYYFRSNEIFRNFLISPLLLSQLTAVFALLPIHFYNGKRGKQNKYFFYLFYPVHLLLFFFIRTSVF